MSVLLEVRDVAKTFYIYKSVLLRFLHWFGLPVKKSKIEVIKKVSFEVNHGEAIAVLGKNGEGKSTLLKIISGTMRPTSGDVSVSGNVAAILELGLGFNAELTGEENARHILAMQESVVDQRLVDGVADFSELGKYFSMPLRTYSSGMLMRLAFSIATIKRPEILIVDEALSVGDANFQHKCIERIKEFRNQGTSLLFVSHDKNAILDLCDTAILLNDGEIMAKGEAKAVLDSYNELLSKSGLPETYSPNHHQGYGNKKVVIEKAYIVNSLGMTSEEVAVGELIKLHVVIKCNEELDEHLSFGFKIRTKFGHEVFGTNTHFHDYCFTDNLNEKLDKIVVEFNANLGPGVYVITGAMHKSSDHIEENYHWVDDLLVFTVINKDKPYFIGSSYLPAKFSHFDA